MTILKRLTVLKRLAGSKWGSSPKLIIDFYKIYIRSKLEYGIQFLTNIPVTLFNTLETLQNSAIRIALGLHKHTAVVKLKELSGLPALKDRATMQRNCYFKKYKHMAKSMQFSLHFGNPAKPQHLLSSFSQYLKDYPNWKNEQADSYPFPKSPLWEMVAPECHLQLVLKTSHIIQISMSVNCLLIRYPHTFLNIF